MDGASLLRPCQRVLADPVGLRGFQRQTRGTATQAIKALEAVVPVDGHSEDGAKRSLRLTSKGKKRLRAIRSKF